MTSQNEIFVKLIHMFTESSDRCERAFRFTECFWENTKEVRWNSTMEMMVTFFVLLLRNGFTKNFIVE